MSDLIRQLPDIQPTARDLTARLYDPCEPATIGFAAIWLSAAHASGCTHWRGTNGPARNALRGVRHRGRRSDMAGFGDSRLRHRASRDRLFAPCHARHCTPSPCVVYSVQGRVLRHWKGRRMQSRRDGADPCHRPVHRSSRRQVSLTPVSKSNQRFSGVNAGCRNARRVIVTA